MRDELNRVRALAPQPPAPSPAVRDAARTRLLAVIEAAPAGAGPVGADRSRPRVARRRGGLGGLLSIGLAVATVVVTVVTITLLGHHAHRDRPAPAGPAGPGRALTAGGAPLHGPLATALRREYGLGAGALTLRTSIDSALQRVADRSLRRSERLNRARAGGFVALDPRTGAVLAISGPRTAIGGAGPIGSTAMPFTALAALATGAWDARDTYDDTGAFCVGHVCLHNAGGAAYGRLNLRTALQVEDDLFFADLGDRLTRGRELGRWMDRFGLDGPTGIDLPGEAAGRLPRAALDPGSGWSPLRDIALAVGQEAAVTPLQLAVAEAAIANGGRIVVPHVGASLRRAGRLIRRIDPAPRARLPLSTGQLATVTAGLRASTARPGGVTDDVFGSLPVHVAGSVGTAQSIMRARETDDAWFAGFAPATRGRGPLVVVVHVRGGGFGAVAAAPVARQMLNEWFTGRPGRYVAGTSIAR